MGYYVTYICSQLWDIVAMVAREKIFTVFVYLNYLQKGHLCIFSLKLKILICTNLKA